MPTAYDALEESSASSSDDDESSIKAKEKHHESCFEDLTTQREHEETVLAAVYGDDYSKQKGVWGHPILCVHVRPPDLEPERIGSELMLKVHLMKRYPIMPPDIQLENVSGLTDDEQRLLMTDLKKKCHSLAKSGEVMVWELVQVVENFLLIHNKDPKNAGISAWDQMQAREEEEKKLAMKAERRLDFMYEDTSRAKDQYDDSFHNSNHNDIDEERINKEYARQKEAVKAAEVKRHDHISADEDENDLSSDDEEDDYEYDASNALSSRYQSDFIELGLLGRGGGGEVVKVRNRLDRRVYAVKKVVMQPESGKYERAGKQENAKLKREVTTISRMTHKNIVRYYQAWVEGGETPEDPENSIVSNNSVNVKDANDNTSINMDESESSVSGGKRFWMSSFNDDGSSDDSSSSSSSWSNEDDDRTSANPQYSEDIDFVQSPLMVGFDGIKKLETNLMKQYQKQSKSISSNLFDESESDLYDKKNDGSRRILYIQMEYCTSSLRHFIDDNSLQKMEEEEVWKMVRQILEALQYIHKLKVIHRDLKPGNIFLDSENNVRLGDFGLATTRKQRPEEARENASIQLDDISHLLGGSSYSYSKKTQYGDTSITGGVGTRFYCAPEQEGHNSSSRTDYDNKVDIYSLGIVLFEMFHPPFSTMMHRAETLEKLRASSEKYLSQLPKGRDILENNLWKEHVKLRFPDNINFPENVQKIILWCVQFDSSARPSAADILKSELIPQQENHMEMLNTLFNRQTASGSNEIDITFDTDAAAKVREFFPASGKNSLMNNLIHNLQEIGGLTWRDFQTVQSSVMSHVPMCAANITLRRALNAGKIRGASQNTASVLAMAAAATSASTGNADGCLSRLNESICNQFKSLFESHGAVKLSSPLLRPKGRLDIGIDGVVEVMNERGVILTLPDDLTATFARSIGRAGGLGGLKRYDIDKTYHKSKIGGHPLESLEASFDIVLEGLNAQSDVFEAETILLVSQAMKTFVRPLSNDSSCSNNSKFQFDPFWFFRVTHTRLADAILDICEVPTTNDHVRRICLNILTRCSAPSPLSFWNQLSENCNKLKSSRKESNGSPPLQLVLDDLLENAVKSQGLPKTASDNLKIFLTNGCLPLPTDVSKALQNLQEAVKKVRSVNEKNRKNKRFVDIAKGIKSLQKLVKTLQDLGLISSPTCGFAQKSASGMLSPAFISLDLGLRQKQKHFQGQLYFQALLLPSNWDDDPFLFNSNDRLLSHSPKLARKMAEGGHYEDIVRKFRPPGNFGSVQVDKYTSAPIPMCIGTRFFLKRFVEQAYVEAAHASEKEADTVKSTSNADVESMRKLLGQPEEVYPKSIQCVIVSTSGFDLESLPTRLYVASILWSDGISAEYVAQSGVINNGLSYNSGDWTLDQIEGICSVLGIPFLVIVQDHLLKVKQSVRLRLVKKEFHYDISTSEDFVPLASLSSVLRSHLNKNDYYNCETNNSLLAPERSKSQTLKQLQNQDASNTKSNLAFDIECIIVDSQFYCEEHLSGRNLDQKSRSISKLADKCTLRAQDHLQRLFTSSTHGDGCIVLAVHLPFKVLREFDSIAMFGSQPTVAACVSETLLMHIKHRKTLKSLAMCLDYLIHRQSSDLKYKPAGKSSKQLFSAFIYSIEDDRFDFFQRLHHEKS